MDGMFLTERHSWLILSGQVVGDHLISVAALPKEGSAAGFASFSVFSDYSTSNGPTASDFNPTTSNDYFFTVTQDIEGLRIKGSYKVLQPRNGIPLTLRTSTNRTILLGTLNNASQIDFDVVFDAYAGEKFFLWVDESGLIGSAILETEISIEVKSRHRTTYVKFLPPEAFFAAIGKKITGKDDATASQLFSENGGKVYTSGDGLRSLPNSVIKTSLNSFFDDARVRYAAGLGVEGKKLVIESFEHFLDTSDPIHLGKVKDLKVSVATDLLANTLKVGYNAQTIDDVNGKYSFNNTHIYSSPITKISRELNLVSPYITDPYVIELYRINSEGKSTTDKSNDNNVFVLDVERLEHTFSYVLALASAPFGFFISSTEDISGDFRAGGKFTVSNMPLSSGTYTVQETVAVTGGYNVYTVEPTVAEAFNAVPILTDTYVLNRPPYITLTGVPDPPTVFNVELSPKRIALKHIKWLSSIFHGFAGESLKFETTEKNRDLKTTGGPGSDINEDADVVIGSSKLFTPRYVDFDTEVPVDLVTMMEENPNRCFTFETQRGLILEAFSRKTSIAPGDGQEQAYRLLLSPNNDLTKIE